MTEHRIIQDEDGRCAAEVKRDDGEWVRWAVGSPARLASMLRANIAGQRRRAAELAQEPDAMERAVSEWMAATGKAIQTRVLARFIGPNAREDAAAHAGQARYDGHHAEAERGWVGWEVVAVTVVDLP